jgi:hypothetical protein
MTPFPDLHTRPWLALLLVAALALRGLIPDGYMPVASAGGMSMELCPGAAALPPGLAGHAHGLPPRHAGHTGHGSGDPGAAHHPTCLFSTGASTAFAAVLAAPALMAPALTGCGDRPCARLFVPAILRAQSSRGPPLFA